ncbi:SAM hydroxide adenosyltransferase [Mesorhizobium amorphae]|uniref:SAM hydroxide adenosyltransferase n=1 Tax=Mesorhizobium amorphae TaxID=71433 RepID=UPI000B6E4D7F|nr:hypothetical protein AJ88_13215 [Mesorhizobium amorphae CCBAU 01583]
MPAWGALACAAFHDGATTFSNRPPGTAFWYENSNGLAEIAVNQGRTNGELGLAIGSSVEIVL